MVIAIDFDGTCVSYNFPKIGKNINSVPVLKKLIENGHKLILFTMRSENFLDEAVEWFRQNEIPLYGIQINPTQRKWTKSTKCYAELYIDDSALGCPLTTNNDLSERPFVDWEKIELILINKGLIPNVQKNVAT